MKNLTLFYAQLILTNKCPPSYNRLTQNALIKSGHELKTSREESFHEILNIFLLIIIVGTRAYAFDPGPIISDAIRSYNQVQDYTCLFYKKELIQDRYVEQKNIIMKYRKPFSIYMKWTEGDVKGQEVLYVQGRNDNKLKAHTGGVLKWLTLNLDPGGSVAMKDNRHTVLDAHIGKVIDICDTNYRLSRQLSVGSFELCEEKMIAGRAHTCIKANFPEDRGFYGGGNYIYIDKEYKFPTAVEIYGWKNELLEKYEHTQIRSNVGLTDKDFDPKNKDYNF